MNGKAYHHKCKTCGLEFLELGHVTSTIKERWCVRCIGHREFETTQLVPIGKDVKMSADEIAELEKPI